VRRAVQFRGAKSKHDRVWVEVLAHATGVKRQHTLPSETAGGQVRPDPDCARGHHGLAIARVEAANVVLVKYGLPHRSLRVDKARTARELPRTANALPPVHREVSDNDVARLAAADQGMTLPNEEIEFPNVVVTDFEMLAGLASTACGRRAPSQRRDTDIGHSAGQLFLSLAEK
jgi:hypothetical protein